MSKSKSIFDVYQNRSIDIKAFWRAVFHLPVRDYNKATYSNIICDRFNYDGSVKMSFGQIAKQYGVSSKAIQQKYEKALWHLAHFQQHYRFIIR